MNKKAEVKEVVFFQSLIKSLTVVIKAGAYVMDEHGHKTLIPAKRIEFVDYRYIPKNKEELEFLEEYIKNPRKAKRCWKVTPEDRAVAREYKKELDELNKKFRDKKAKLMEIEGTKSAGTGATTSRGMSNSDGNSDGESGEDPDWRQKIIDDAKAEAKKEVEKELKAVTERAEAAEAKLETEEEEQEDAIIEDAPEEGTIVEDSDAFPDPEGTIVEDDEAVIKDVKEENEEPEIEG